MIPELSRITLLIAPDTSISPLSQITLSMTAAESDSVGFSTSTSSQSETFSLSSRLCCGWPSTAARLVTTPVGRGGESVRDVQFELQTLLWLAQHRGPSGHHSYRTGRGIRDVQFELQTLLWLAQHRGTSGHHSYRTGRGTSQRRTV